MILILAMLLMTVGCSRSTPPLVEGDIVAAPAGSFIKEWGARLDIKNSRLKSIHQGENLVFGYDYANNAFVLNRANGHLRFVNNVELAKGDLGDPVVLPEAIVYPMNVTLEIFKRNGFFDRTLELNAPIRSAGVGKDEMLYIGADYPAGGRMMSLDISRLYGENRWELMTFGTVTAAPAVWDDIVYVASHDGAVYASLDERQPVWNLDMGRFMTGGAIVADLKIDDYALYVASTDSKLYALGRTTGRVRWQYFAGAPLTTPPAATRTVVYQFVPSQGLVAISKIEGAFNRKAKWINRDMTQFLAEDGDLVFARGRDNRVVALDRETGQERFRSRRTFDLFLSNTRDGAIFVGTSGGELLQLKAVTRPGTVGEVVMASPPAPAVLLASSK